ncbi:MAG: hypothetical protein ACXV3D_03135 [Halobacteriota archaeon]
MRTQKNYLENIKFFDNEYKNGMCQWLQKVRIPLTWCNAHFFASDLRKFAEQRGDVVGWNESNRAYILTHGVRGIKWGNYRHLLRIPCIMFTWMLGAILHYG